MLMKNRAAALPRSLAVFSITVALAATARAEISAQPTAQEITHARIFEEPLVAVDGNASTEENAALSSALRGYSNRQSADDFSSLTTFIEKHPQSVWNASLLT